jgi:AcrR family transcriptional regulator
MIEVDESAAEFRRAHVLASATKVFLAYGFAKATMDDIARAAEMSRPAIYLHFKNKTDIYRSIALDMLTLSAAQAKAELERPGPFADRLERAIDVAIISMIASFSTTPHGAEFLDMKSSLADLIGTWRGHLLDQIADAIASEARRTGVDLVGKGFPARMLADTLMDRLDGVKARTVDPDAQRQAARIQIRLIDNVLQAQGR